MKSYFVIVLFVSQIIANSCEICKKVSGLQDFQPEKVVGIWYKVAWIPLFYGIELQCPTVNFTLNLPKVIPTYLDGKLPNGEDVEFVVTLEYDSASVNVADFIFEAKKDNVVIVNKFPISLISIDYDTYQIYYSCLDGMEEYLWIFSRKLPIAEDFVEKITNVLDENGISTKQLVYDPCFF